MYKDDSKFPKRKSKTITYFAYGLIALLILFFIFKVEQYLLYYPIKFILSTIIQLIASNINNNWICFISLFIIFYLHLILFRMCIFSIAFLLGGFGKRFIVYSHFKVWIEFIITNLVKVNSYLKSGNFDNLFNKMESIESFHKNYNIDKLNNISIEIKDALFGDLLNEVMYIYHQFKEENAFTNQNDIEKFDSLATKIDTLVNKLSYYKKFGYIDVFTKFNAYAFLHQSLLQFFDELPNHKSSLVKITSSFEAVLISPKEGSNELSNKSIKTLVVICNQNAVSVELYSNGCGNLKPYIDLPNTSILLWNYKGYGMRSGFPTFSSINNDTRNIANYINKEFPNYKIVIHGISIGGYAAIRLAKELNDEKNVFLIADRTFSNIEMIVKTLPYGNILQKIYKCVLPSILYSSLSVNNYIGCIGKHKMICYDEKDSIILYSASLIRGLTKKYYKEYLYGKLMKEIRERKDRFINVNQEKNIAKMILDDNEIKIIHHEIDDICNNIKNNAKQYLKKIRGDFKLNNFIMNTFVYGYEAVNVKEIFPDKEDRERSFTYFPIYLKSIVTENKGKLSEGILKLLSKINLLFVVTFLNTELSQEDIESFRYEDIEKFEMKNEIEKELVRYFGSVHRIYCGHNGELRANDVDFILEVLQNNGFIEGDSNEDNNGIN